jgi:hypothetical protein
MQSYFRKGQQSNLRRVAEPEPSNLPKVSAKVAAKAAEYEVRG